MLERSGHIHVGPGSERSFGLVFAAVFAIVALYPLLEGGSVRWLAVGGALVLATGALLRPGLFRVPNRLWFRFGALLGRFVSPVVMALVYIVAVLPTGLLMRLAGKDPLRLAGDREAPTYWIERDWPMQPMQHQF